MCKYIEQILHFFKKKTKYNIVYHEEGLKTRRVRLSSFEILTEHPLQGSSRVQESGDWLPMCRSPGVQSMVRNPGHQHRSK